MSWICTQLDFRCTTPIRTRDTRHIQPIPEVAGLHVLIALIVLIVLIP